MQKYSIYCTPEQTKRAYKLGAPIEQVVAPNAYYEAHKDKLSVLVECEPENVYLQSPTAEQMFGWFDKKGVVVEVFRLPKYHENWCVYINENRFWNTFAKTRKEITNAAIDAALDYLEKGENT